MVDSWCLHGGCGWGVSLLGDSGLIGQPPVNLEWWVLGVTLVSVAAIVFVYAYLFGEDE